MCVCEDERDNRDDFKKFKVQTQRTQCQAHGRSPPLAPP